MPLYEICEITQPLLIIRRNRSAGHPHYSSDHRRQSDAHRTRVNKLDASDIHDRVNHAIIDSSVSVNI